MDLFEAAELGRRLRDIGLDKVESNNHDWVSRARAIAIRLAQINGGVTADDIRPLIEPPTHANAWGAVFRGKELMWSGQLKVSNNPARHAGMQRVWILRQ